MDKEIAQYVNTLLADRKRLIEERKEDNKQWQGIPELYFDLKKDTEWELSMIYHAQKAMDYIIEEEEGMEDDPNAEFDAASYTQEEIMKRRYMDAYYNLRSNTSLDRFNRDEWNNTFDAINDLAKADLEEQQQVNLIIKEDI